MVTDKDRKAQLLEDYKITFGSSEGERVLEDLMQYTSIAGELMGATEAATNRNIGTRDVGRYILTMLKYSIKDFIFNTRGDT